MSVNYPNIDASFPRSINYRCGNRPSAVQETAATVRHFPYGERHLQCLWADPRHRPAGLETTAGEMIAVEYAGDWNLEAGPDFLNAVLLVGKEKRRICGDLEIHIHANGWDLHGHGDDPRYSNVRFHIVYFPGIEISGLIQIPLEEILSANPRFSFENIDLTAYPYSIPVGGFPLKDMHPDRKIHLLESAGEERLRLKAERLALSMQSKDPEQVLWEELLAGLGYKNNKAPFRHLAIVLPLARMQSLTSTPDEAYALLLGLSGLLPVHPTPGWDAETRAFVRSVWDVWWKQNEELQEMVLHKSDWTLSGIRPANHPFRRLMAAAHYAFRISEIADNASKLTTFADNFWSRHISWITKCEPTALVGRSRANALTTNILFPWRAAAGVLKPNLARLPVEPTNSIIRQTAHALFGPDHTPKVYKSALARQGLIQIFHDYLITHRLHELKKKFGGTLSSMSKTGGGTTSPLSADDGDIVPPKNADTKTGGTASPSRDHVGAECDSRWLSKDDGDIVPPKNADTKTGGGTTSPSRDHVGAECDSRWLSKDDGDIVPPKNADTKTGGGTTSPSRDHVGAECDSRWLSKDDGDIVPPPRKPDYTNRKHPAHHPPIEQVNRTPIIFLTICTHKRRKILDNDTMHEALKTAWRKADDWIIGRYIIMPDHIHLFCSPATKESVNVAQWVSYWKRLASKQLKNNQSIWQRDCWDTQLRGHESYTEKWEYIRNNPVRAGLVDHSADWSFQGTINHLPW